MAIDQLLAPCVVAAAADIMKYGYRWRHCLAPFRSLSGRAGRQPRVMVSTQEVRPVLELTCMPMVEMAPMAAVRSLYHRVPPFLEEPQTEVVRL